VGGRKDLNSPTIQISILFNVEKKTRSDLISFLMFLIDREIKQSGKASLFRHLASASHLLLLTVGVALSKSALQKGF